MTPPAILAELNISGAGISLAIGAALLGAVAVLDRRTPRAPQPDGSATNGESVDHSARATGPDVDCTPGDAMPEPVTAEVPAVAPMPAPPAPVRPIVVSGRRSVPSMAVLRTDDSGPDLPSPPEAPRAPSAAPPPPAASKQATVPKRSVVPKQATITGPGAGDDPLLADSSEPQSPIEVIDLTDPGSPHPGGGKRRFRQLVSAARATTAAPTAAPTAVRDVVPHSALPVEHVGSHPPRVTLASAPPQAEPSQPESAAAVPSPPAAYPPTSQTEVPTSQTEAPAAPAAPTTDSATPPETVVASADRDHEPAPTKQAPTKQNPTKKAPSKQATAAAPGPDTHVAETSGPDLNTPAAAEAEPDPDRPDSNDADPHDDEPGGSATKMPRGAEAAILSIIEAIPDPRNLLAEKDPTAEISVRPVHRSDRQAGKPPATGSAGSGRWTGSAATATTDDPTRSRGARPAERAVPSLDPA